MGGSRRKASFKFIFRLFLSFACVNETKALDLNTEPIGAAEAAGARTPGAAAEPGQRYPVSEEYYYVLSCMAINGNDALGLKNCSCAIAALEQRLSYDRYKDAEMVVALRRAGGPNAGIFRDTSSMRDIVKDFTEAQKAANSQCFGKSAAPQENAAAGK